MRNIKISFKTTLTETTPQNHEGFRDFEPEFIHWNGSADGIYVQTDAAQKAVLLALSTKMRLFLKWVPDREFNQRGNRRWVMIGLVVVTEYKTNHHVAEAAIVNISFQGSGKPFTRLESESQADDCNPCCVGLSQSLYMVRGESWVAPPAPENSTGWVVEKNFYPIEYGTGDIGTIFLSTINPVTGLPFPAGVMNCPVHVSFHYLCDSSDYIPATSDPVTEFNEIWENTGSPTQEAVFRILEEAVGFRIGDEINGSTVDAVTLFVAFNYEYLIDNPDFTLDISRLGLTDLSIVNTLTNLKKLNCSHNYLTIFDMAALVRPQLTWLDCSYNFIGNDNLEMAFMTASLKYLDMSFNYMNEVYMYSSIAIGSTKTLDYLNYSNNFLAICSNNKAIIKVFEMKNNIYPRDLFWTPQINDPDSSIKIAGATNAMLNYSICEKIDISNSELFDEPNDPETIANFILVDNPDVTTIEQARARVIYDPKYSEGSHAPYDMKNLPRYWNDQNLT